MRSSAQGSAGSSGQQSARMGYEQAQRTRARLAASIKARAPSVARGVGNVLLVAVLFVGLIALAVASGSSSRQSQSQAQLESIQRMIDSQRQIQRDLAFDHEAFEKMMASSRLLMAQDFAATPAPTLAPLVEVTPAACWLAEGEPLDLEAPPAADLSVEPDEGLPGELP